MCCVSVADLGFFLSQPATQLVIKKDHLINAV